MTLVAFAVCLACAIGLAICSAALARSVSPALATVVLTVTALATSTASGFVACVLAFDALAALPEVASLGRWQPADLGSLGGTPWAGAAAGLLAVVLIIRAVRTAGLETAALWRSAGTCRHAAHAAGLVITTEPTPPRALAGFPGRILIGASTLAQLSPAHQRALLAHEEAHLTRRHHLYLQLVELAVAANPILTPVRPAVRFATERWADEAAAAVTGDRRAVATAIASVATAVQCGSTTALAAAADDIVERVKALLRARPRTRALPVTLMVLLLTGPVLTAGTVERHTESVFEHAHVTGADGAALVPATYSLPH